ncbi:hypothetical protein D9757_007726 [Collybiopsis confluens]|uniref:Uncharacterized protein n=1 Tax=Collybiopsis confluens TaxID=2823264 RepID=A0A8H5H5K0_9AGAR|nr:hypothetical protein D9757_007726 [Collybiopsis confluens]
MQAKDWILADYCCGSARHSTGFEIEYRSNENLKSLWTSLDIALVDATGLFDGNGASGRLRVSTATIHAAFRIMPAAKTAPPLILNGSFEELGGKIRGQSGSLDFSCLGLGAGFGQEKASNTRHGGQFILFQINSNQLNSRSSVETIGTKVNSPQLQVPDDP